MGVSYVAAEQLPAMRALRVLLVEDDRADARLTVALLKSGRPNAEVTHCLTLASACERRAEAFDVVLSDLNLPDSSGTATVARLTLEFPGIPLIALTIDSEHGLACIAAGAQDFLPKIELNRKTLGRAVDFSLQRANQTRQAEIASRHDALTGLLNRASFEEAAMAAITIAYEDYPFSIALFIDVDEFKGINDKYGHAVGDQILKSVARELRSTVRTEDLVCRWGGDEFVVFGRAESASAASNMAIRVQQRMRFLQAIDDESQTPFYVEVDSSVGVAIDSELEVGTLAALIDSADSAMYAQKSGQAFREVPKQNQRHLRVVQR